MTSGSAAAAEAIRLGDTTLKLFERGVYLLIEKNLAPYAATSQTLALSDLGRTGVPGVRLESEMDAA
jgi:hypothetical protein